MKIIHHKSQRVGVFVDVQNLYYSARQVYNDKNPRINFEKLLKNSVDGRNLVRAFAYVIKAEAKQENEFFEALQKIGFEVKSKDLQTFKDGTKKGDWDVGIAVDAIRLSPNLDTVILASGDGDYVDLILYLKSHGIRVEVFSFAKTTSDKIVQTADELIDLDNKIFKL
ncbi:MAG: NYN domain-containing protein [Patescibacteria group bacterium]